MELRPARNLGRPPETRSAISPAVLARLAMAAVFAKITDQIGKHHRFFLVGCGLPISEHVPAEEALPLSRTCQRR